MKTAREWIKEEELRRCRKALTEEIKCIEIGWEAALKEKEVHLSVPSSAGLEGLRTDLAKKAVKLIIFRLDLALEDHKEGLVQIVPELLKDYEHDYKLLIDWMAD